MEKLLKGFINLKAWLLISVHIDETERIMRTQKSLLILHAVQQECLNVWICLCGLISFLNALGLEIEALTAVDRGIRSESLLGEDQVADLSGRGIESVHSEEPDLEEIRTWRFFRLII